MSKRPQGTSPGISIGKEYTYPPEDRLGHFLRNPSSPRLAFEPVKDLSEQFPTSILLGSSRLKRDFMKLLEQLLMIVAVLIGTTPNQSLKPRLGVSSCKLIHKICSQGQGQFLSDVKHIY